MVARGCSKHAEDTYFSSEHRLKHVEHTYFSKRHTLKNVMDTYFFRRGTLKSSRHRLKTFQKKSRKSEDFLLNLNQGINWE